MPVGSISFPSSSLLCLLLLTGCPGVEPPATGGDGSSSGPPATTTGADGSGGVDGTGTSGDTAATDGGTTGSADDASSGEPTTTGESATPCDDVCPHIAECGLSSLEGCLLDCEFYFEEISGHEACEQAANDLWECFGQAACEDIDTRCEAEAEAEFLACEKGLGCSGDVEGAIDGSSCSITQTCGDGLDRTLDCDSDTCLCIDQGKMTGSCPARTLCLDMANLPLEQFEETIDEFLFECCGWDPPVPPIDQ